MRLIGLSSIGATTTVAHALLDSSPFTGSELDMVRSLCDASEAELATRLLDGQIAGSIGHRRTPLRPELQKLRSMSAASGAALHAKFAQEVSSGKGFQLKYADLRTEHRLWWPRGEDWHPLTQLWSGHGG